MSTGHIGKMPIGYMVCKNIGKGKPPIDSFGRFFLTIVFQFSGADNTVASTANLKGNDRTALATFSQRMKN